MTKKAVVIVKKENALTPARSLPADQTPALVYLASLGSPNSKRAMSNALNLIADVLTRDQLDKANHLRYQLLDWSALRFQHTAAIRAALTERVKYTTANNALSALRGVLKAAYRLGQISPDDYAKASDIGTVKGQSVPAGRDLAMGEIMALADVCKADKSPAGVRDLALIGVLYVCGLRRAEIVGLAVGDYDPSTGKLAVRSGKGRKDRTVYVTNGALAGAFGVAQGARYTGRADVLRDEQAGRMTAQGMSAQAVYLILAKRATQAGVKDFSPHDMRRTFVSDMLDRGADIATVAKLAGHASVTTTARYDRRDEETKRKAAGLLHFPA